MWLVTLSIYLLMSGVVNLQRRQFGKHFDKYAIVSSFIILTFGLLPIGAVAGFFFEANFDVGLNIYLIMIAGTVMWPLAGVFGLKANKYLDATDFQIVYRTAAVFAIFIAIIFLGETLTSLQVAGIILILSGAYVVTLSGKHSSFKKLIKNKGFLWALAAAALVGGAIPHERAMIEHFGVGAYMRVGWGAQVIWAFIILSPKLGLLKQALWTDKKMRRFWPPFIGAVALQSIMFLISLSLVPATIMAPASSLAVVVVLITSYIFLKERDHMPQKIAGSLLSVAGLVLLAI